MEQVVDSRARMRGRIRMPGDKSISHRALILGALARGTTEVKDLSPARDVQSTTNCLRALGVEIQSGEVTSHHVRICGVGIGGLRRPSVVLDAGNSGTTMRLLAGVLAGHTFPATITGDESLRRRPMQRVIEPLTRMGSQIESDNGFAPLRIQGGSLRGIDYELPVASSQVKSAVLLAGLHAEGVTTVVEPVPTRDHTERILEYVGARLLRDGHRVSLVGKAVPLIGRSLVVAGDISSAAFFLSAAIALPQGELTIDGVGLNPTRTGFLDAVRSMGAQLAIRNERLVNNEPCGSITVRSSTLQAVEVRGALVPRMIDELPMLAVLATQAKGTTVITDAAELRVKETDRIAAVAENLQRMGARIETRRDGWIIPGAQRLRGARIASYGDHRIVMAFAIAALIAQRKTVIEGAEWADISHPGFFEQLASLTS